MKIIYVGPLWDGSTCKQRMQAFMALGHEVLLVNTQSDKIRKLNLSLIYKIIQRAIGPIDLAKANDQIIQKVMSAHSSIDVIWIDKGVTIKPRTLKKVKKHSQTTILVHYNPDDPFGRLRHDGWGNFLACARFYDIHFVPRPQNIIEYKALGCENIYLFKRSYDPQTHHDFYVDCKDKKIYGGSVGFIGSYEKERALDILYLAENGIPVRIWGLYWHKAHFLKHPNIKIENKALYADNYSKAISSFDINLNFLRKDNRDFHNSRSVEIPACGGFMLAERSTDHLRLFEEGKEAEYFGNREELLEKIKYYLSEKNQRTTIAKAGHLRCINSGYNTIDRMRTLLEIAANFKK